jgi:hypothetical protein
MNKPKTIIVAALALASLGVTPGLTHSSSRRNRRRHNCRKRRT